jgi:molecular chaperone GrpE
MEQTNDEQKIDTTVEELKKQADEYLNGWKRAKADLTNFQNDAAKERINWAKFASAGTLQRLLPALDTLYAAAEHAPELGDTVKKFEEYLRGEDMAEIDCQGKYDPAVHEVISMEKNEGAESGSIVKVAQRGYKLHDQVLRPAKVIVAE